MNITNHVNNNINANSTTNTNIMMPARGPQTIVTLAIIAVVIIFAVVEAVAVIAVEQGRTTTAGVCGPVQALREQAV